MITPHTKRDDAAHGEVKVQQELLRVWVLQGTAECTNLC